MSTKKIVALTLITILCITGLAAGYVLIYNKPINNFEKLIINHTYFNSNIVNNKRDSINNFNKAYVAKLSDYIMPSSSKEEDEAENESVLTAKKALEIGKKNINFKAKRPYSIMVNRKMNYVLVLGIDKHNKYTIPYKVFLCSTAKNIKNTPLGTFYIGEKYRWQTMVDGTHSQYAIRIFGQIMFHSIPYTSRQHNKMEVSEYNKLGSPASLGCIRLRVADVKWIYDNCPQLTAVTIYSKKINPPIKLPVIKKINGKKLTYDPTDPKIK